MGRLDNKVAIITGAACGMAVTVARAKHKDNVRLGGEADESLGIICSCCVTCAQQTSPSYFHV